ncbi:unnamed protein product [Blepharisma stoltei]|uniref:Translin-associated factor X-interacting protein 1 N-terminal domain-containing protein n=1 Tax=Blepharisma stoltei TaxID=1481888 RepID=A0AAU9J7M1_9CILI|nr:unnamed protein product [Blepharisma stoltei]
MNRQKSAASFSSLNYSSYQSSKPVNTSITSIKPQLIKPSPYSEPNPKPKTNQVRKKESSPIQMRHSSPGMKKSSSNASFQTNPSSKLKNQTFSHSNLFASIENNHSSPTNASKSLVKSMNFSFNNTANAAQNNPYKETGQYQSRISTASTEIQILEGRLSQQLRELSLKDSERIPDKLEIFRDLFQEIIKKDTIYSPLLSKIRDAYDEVIGESREKMANDINSRLNELNGRLSKCIEEKRILEKRIEKISKEKYEMEIMLEECNIQNNRLKDKLQKSSKKSFPDFDDKSVGLIIDENKSLSKICQKQKNEIDSYKYKEKQLLKLILALKKKGYPVEEIYDREVQKSKYEMYKNEENSELGEESEDEQLVSGRPKDVPRPRIVPKLNLNEVKPDTPSSYSDSNESSPVSNVQSI